MREDNFIAVIGVLKQASPFQPFTIELHGGMRFEIDHPDALDLLESIAIFHAPGSIPILFDHECVSHIFDCPLTDIPNGPYR